MKSSKKLQVDSKTRGLTIRFIKDVCFKSCLHKLAIAKDMSRFYLQFNC